MIEADRIEGGTTLVGLLRWPRAYSLSPRLQNAGVAATGANGGLRMEPHMVQQLQSPDLTALATTQPVAVEQAITPEVASTLTQLMIGSENFTGGTGRFEGATGGGLLQATAFFAPGLPFEGEFSGTIDY